MEITFLFEITCWNFVSVKARKILDNEECFHVLYVGIKLDSFIAILFSSYFNLRLFLGFKVLNKLYSVICECT